MPRPQADLGRRTVTVETQTRTVDLPTDAAGRLLRFAPLAVDTRAAAVDGAAYRFAGQVTPFNDRTWIGGRSWGFWEQNAPGSFAKTIREKRSENNDITFNREHDNQFILARTSNGTLVLTETDDGLQSEAEWGDYSYARDAALAIERRDLTGMSYAFGMVTYEWSIAEDGKDLLTHREVEMFDAAVVGLPAYANTSAGLRFDMIALARSVGMDGADLDRLARRLADPDEHTLDALRSLAGAVNPPAPVDATRDTTSQPDEPSTGDPFRNLRLATLSTRMTLMERIAS